ncbi:MAG: ABC transporter substrate-binding protein, partial [Emcibacteraceae bacterium]|nr:ABC transporter substrate-binding protein [Emcibacteraceae bacterium]
MPKFINSRTLKVLLLSYGIFAWPIVNSTQAQTITYTDQAGRLVKLDKIPERIATIATPAGSMVVTLSGNGDRLVGTSQNSKNALIEGVLNEFFPILNNVSSNIIGNEGNANIEELLNLETDLVLQWARNTKSIEAMENAGLNVVGMRYKKIDIAKTWLTDIGIILRNSSKAEEILAWHDAAYKRITDKTRTI